MEFFILMFQILNYLDLLIVIGQAFLDDKRRTSCNVSKFCLVVTTWCSKKHATTSLSSLEQ